MQPVSSSNIAAVGFDEESQTVTVQFLNGSTYAYKDVREHEFENLRTAPSRWLLPQQEIQKRLSRGLARLTTAQLARRRTTQKKLLVDCPASPSGERTRAEKCTEMWRALFASFRTVDFHFEIF